jgi:hypothetical protein
MWSAKVFFFSFLMELAKVAIHQIWLQAIEENLRILLYFGKSVETYCLNMAISEAFFPQI